MAGLDQPMMLIIVGLADPEHEQHGRCGVASVVEPAVADAGLLEQELPVGPVGAGVEGVAHLRGEHPTALTPCAAGVDVLLLLDMQVVLEEGDELRWWTNLGWARIRR